MKSIEIDGSSLEACVGDARSDRVMITRGGKPVALLVNVEGLDEEQIRLGSDPEFWTLIESRRTQKTINRAELERRLDDADRNKSEHG